jgi:phosphatidate cytidylyltransferase
VVIPLTLAALFLLPPLAWGLLTLAAAVVAGAEWANLVGYQKQAWLFRAGVLLIGLNLLFSPPSNFAWLA